VYSKIINDLAVVPSSGRRPTVTINNEVVINTSKPGYPFRLVEGFLYNRDSNSKERLVVPKPLVKEVLYYFYNEKYYFSRTRIL
jgi:hypothetical protein